MTLSELQVLVGDLTNDPNHDRYTLSQMNSEFDFTQNRWNVEAKIIRQTATITVVAGTRQYPINPSSVTGIDGVVISVIRVTHKGLELKKRDPGWFDLYSGDDWTQHLGTPIAFTVEFVTWDAPKLTVYPTPRDADAGANLVLQFIALHTTMAAAGDKPFTNSDGVTNDLLRHYDWGIAYDVAARLLARDPNEVNSAKSINYAAIARGVLADIVQVYNALQKEEPYRMRGGRTW